MSSILSRPRRLLGLAGLLVLAGSAGADERARFEVRILGVSSPALDPGSFSSVVADVQNFSTRARTVKLDLEAPPGWLVVSSARTVQLSVFERRSVPFTVRVPERASDDAGHEFTLVLTAAEEAFRFPQELRVTPRQAVTLEPLRSPPRALPGERARHVLRIENAGNVSDLYSLTAESTPDWHVSVQPPTVFLRPGENTDVVVEVDVPRRIGPGTLNHVVVTATASPLDIGDPTVARVQLSSVVTIAPRRSSRFHRLPLEVTMSTGRNRRDEPTHGLRLLSDGPWGDHRRLLLESDLRTSGPADARELAVQRARVRLSGPGWEVSAGDVWSEFADVVSPSLGGRGGHVLRESARWSAEGFVHLTRGDEHLPIPTWGGRSTVEARPGLQVEGGFLGRRASDLVAPATDLARESFLTIGTRWNATPELELRSEAALSREVIADSASIGHAGEIRADYRGPALQAKARGYSGGADFAGRVRNEQALLAHARTTLAPGSILWTNLDVVRRGARGAGDPVVLTRNVRLAGQFGDPGTEIFLDSRSERVSIGRETERKHSELLTAWSWRQAGPLLLGLSTRGGWKRDGRADTRAILWGGAAQVVGRLGEVNTSVRVVRNAEYLLDAARNFTATDVHGDLSWAPSWQPMSLGVELRSHSAFSPAGAATTARSVRPRAEWRWGPATRLRVDGTFKADGDRRGLTEWRLQIVWSGEEALPLLWNPRDATPRGRVFLDVDHDGFFGPRDTPLPGVRLSVDGQARISDQHGEFEFPPAIGASYRIELKPGSMPPDLVPTRLFPRELPVTGSRDRFFDVALVPGGEVSGRVYHDTDRDGRAGPAEAGLGDIRMEILREGTRVATNLTDPSGSYSFGKLPPGDYTLRVAAGWMPAGWGATGHPELRIRLAPDDRLRVEPLGLAPRRKPILKTFDGTTGAR